MLDAIQEQLEAIYGIRAEYRAKDFLIDSDAARKLGGSGRSREELLVSEDAEGLEIALYIEPSLLARVSATDPHGAMTATSVRPSTWRSTTPPAEYSRVATTLQVLVTPPSTGTPEVLELRFRAQPVPVTQLGQELVHSPRAHHRQQPRAV